MVTGGSTSFLSHVSIFCFLVGGQRVVGEMPKEIKNNAKVKELKCPQCEKVSRVYIALQFKAIVDCW